MRAEHTAEHNFQIVFHNSDAELHDVEHGVPHPMFHMVTVVMWNIMWN